MNDKWKAIEGSVKSITTAIALIGIVFSLAWCSSKSKNKFDVQIECVKKTGTKYCNLK